MTKDWCAKEFFQEHFDLPLMLKKAKISPRQEIFVRVVNDECLEIAVIVPPNPAKNVKSFIMDFIVLECDTATINYEALILACEEVLNDDNQD